MNRIAFVTTCKNRLHHLQQTLPRWVAEGVDEIVVVDYGCPQGTGDWVEANWPQVRVVRVDDDPGFCAARARNFGAAAVTAEWVCFIDADILVQAGWLRWMRHNLAAGGYYRAGLIDGVRGPETWGTFVLQTQVWRQIGCYDEFFVGWGGEDADLYDRLQLAGIAEREYPAAFVEAIGHTDDERFAYSALKSKRDNRRQHNFYRYAKYVWMTVAGVSGDLSRDQREHLCGLVDAAFARATEGSGDAYPEIVFDVDQLGPWLPQARREGARCRCRLRLERERRIFRRLGRLWRALRSLVGAAPEDAPQPASLNLQAALVSTVLRELHGSPAVGSIRHKSSTFMYGMPSNFRVRVVCSYELPAAVVADPI